MNIKDHIFGAVVCILVGSALGACIVMGPLL